MSAVGGLGLLIFFICELRQIWGLTLAWFSWYNAHAQSRFHKILYQAQKISVSHLETLAFQDVQQNEDCKWKEEQKYLLLSLKKKAGISVVILLIFLTVIYC